jgi:outer membrane protein assembly factor BamB
VAGPAVADDAVLLVAGRAVLALAADTGEVLWTWERNPGPAGTPAVGDELLYHASGLEDASALVARRVDDGREVWRVFTESPIPDAPTVDGEYVYVGTEDGFLLAVDARTGEERWRFEAAAAIEGPPATVAGLLVISAQNPRTGGVTIHGVDRDDGNEAWRFTAPRAVPATAAALGGDGAFVGLSDGRIVKLDLETGNPQWTATPQELLVPGTVPVLSESGLVISDRLHLYLLDPATGRERWLFRLADLRVQDDGRINTLTSSPVIAGRAALIGDAAGVASAVDLRSGRRIWRADVGEGPIALNVGSAAVYVVTTGRDGRVVALEPDPDGELISEVSPTVLFPLRALAAYGAAAFLVGAVILGLFRLLVRLMPEPTVQKEEP